MVKRRSCSSYFFLLFVYFRFLSIGIVASDIRRQAINKQYSHLHARSILWRNRRGDERRFFSISISIGNTNKAQIKGKNVNVKHNKCIKSENDTLFLRAHFQYISCAVCHIQNDYISIPSELSIFW